jgi:hypothetical protein
MLYRRVQLVDPASTDYRSYISYIGLDMGALCNPILQIRIAVSELRPDSTSEISSGGGGGEGWADLRNDLYVCVPTAKENALTLL